MDMSSTGIDISIIIPVYNGKNKISKALNSVLKQNFSGHKIEVIMVDDGSKDGSFDYLESIKKAYETREIMLVALKKKNEGVALTRNYGLKKANVVINRKMLAEMAVSDPAAFTKVAEIAKKTK